MVSFTYKSFCFYKNFQQADKRFPKRDKKSFTLLYQRQVAQIRAKEESVAEEGRIDDDNDDDDDDDDDDEEKEGREARRDGRGGEK